jgi:hypothetical protein
MIDYNLPKNSEKWSNVDYYNHYLQTKRFGFGFIKSFEKKEFQEIKKRTSELKELYFFIYNKLPEDLKQELYYNFNQQLKALIKKQFFDVNKLPFKELKKEIKQPQQSETKKPDEVKKELYNHIFKDNEFEVWQSMFDNFKITESSNTDLRFMYEVMKYNTQIHKIVTVTGITDWINDTYQFSITKLQYTDFKKASNNKRLSTYKLIK